MESLLGRGTYEALVAEIADALATAGRYVRSFQAGPAQHLVDLHWCAHRAGRRLGIQVRVTLVDPPYSHRSDRDTEVTMTVVPRDRVPRQVRLP